MKRRLTYLLLLGLIFSGAYAFTAAPGHKVVSNIYPAQTLSNNKQVLFACDQNADLLSLPLVYIDDNEDDDEEFGPRKKVSYDNLSKAPYNFYEPTGFLQSLQTKFSYATNVESSFPDRYLLLRVIRV